MLAHHLSQQKSKNGLLNVFRETELEKKQDIKELENRDLSKQFLETQKEFYL